MSDWSWAKSEPLSSMRRAVARRPIQMLFRTLVGVLPLILSTSLSSPAVAWTLESRVWNSFFGPASSELSPYARSYIQKIVAERTSGRCPLKVTATGHVDGAEARTAPIDLDVERAQAVADHIRSLGTPAWIFAIRGDDSARPLQPQRLGVSEAMNRRVELRFEPIGASGRIECASSPVDDASPPQCVLVMADGTKCSEALEEADLWRGTGSRMVWTPTGMADLRMSGGPVVTFPTSSSDLTDEARNAIVAFVADNDGNCPLFVELTGHVDGPEARAAPMQLDIDRARSVAREFRRLGATAWTIKLDGRHVREATDLRTAERESRRVDIRYRPVLATGKLECQPPDNDYRVPKCTLVLPDGSRCPRS